MATTTLPAMKAALATQLAARPGLSGVHITRALPSQSLATIGELITLAGAATDQVTPMSMGMGAPQAFEEEYTTTVLITVIRQGGDGAGVEDRAFAIMGEVTAQIASDPKVSSTVDAAWFDGYDAANRTNERARECFIALHIKCKAEI